MLSSMLLLLGMMTIVMFLVWLSATIIWDRPVAKVTLEDVGGGGSGNNMTGGDKDLEEPNPEEVPEVVEQKVEQALESITSLVSTEVVALDSVGGETSFGRGEGTGTGDGRGKGPGGPGTSDGIPAWERWEIKFSAKDIKTYAQQLDFFKVEFGVAGGGIAEVDYCSNFSSATPTRRKGKPKDERRLRFMNRVGDLRDADRSLAAKAGIQVTDRVVFQFYTPEMYTTLLTLENQKMGKRRIIEVKKTTFGIRGTPSKWEFYVLDQTYRAPTPYKSE
ncbi:MAG: hypothetical protein K8R36_17255 [Planctomycetales bacterium]|nr:hypothetical protein [Planctomycetales bacterium]